MFLNKSKDMTIVGLSLLSFSYFTYGAVQTVGAVPNQNNHGECSAGQDLNPQTDNSFTYTADTNEVVSGVCVKAGSDNQGDGHSPLITSDTTIDNCYVISGIGTSTIQVTRIGQGPQCKGISHVDVITETIEVNTSPTPSPTPEVTATPIPSVTPTPTVTTSPTPVATPTVTPSPSPSASPSTTPSATPSTVTPTPSPNTETNSDKDSTSDNSNNNSNNESTDQVLGAASDTYKPNSYANTGIISQIAGQLIGMLGSILVISSRLISKK